MSETFLISPKKHNRIQTVANVPRTVVCMEQWYIYEIGMVLCRRGVGLGMQWNQNPRHPNLMADGVNRIGMKTHGYQPQLATDMYRTVADCNPNRPGV